MNFGNNNIISVSCPKCLKENNIKVHNIIIKLPHYLIFTLERNLKGINKVSINPNEIIDMRKFIDKCLHIDE